MDKNHWLFKINNTIDWNPIQDIMNQHHDSPWGRPAYDPLIMFKVLLLQQWFNLSDPQAEAQIKDRISFKLFLGLGLADKCPDETTICKFRNQIIEKGLHEKLFQEINSQLEKRGIIVKAGTIVDATFLQSARKPPKKGEAPKDPDASWGKKGKKRCYGYKRHVGVDVGSGMIRTTDVTTARTHDGVNLENLVVGDEKEVYGDKAYYGETNRKILESRNIGNKIMDKAVRGRSLTSEQKERNKAIAKVRSRVERVFAVIKFVWGHCRARYVGEEKNAAHFSLIAMAYNLRRACTLVLT